MAKVVWGGKNFKNEKLVSLEKKNGARELDVDFNPLRYYTETSDGTILSLRNASVVYNFETGEKLAARYFEFETEEGIADTEELRNIVYDYVMKVAHRELDDDVVYDYVMKVAPKKIDTDDLYSPYDCEMRKEE